LNIAVFASLGNPNDLASKPEVFYVVPRPALDKLIITFMPTKRTRRTDGAEPSAAADAWADAAYRPGAKLRPSDITDVWLNELNIPCDADGVALSFKQVKARDLARFEEVIGEEVTSPAQLLKAVALDPRQPMNQRISAAISAAPYYNRKQPIALDGGLNPDTGRPIPLAGPDLSGLSDADVTTYVALLRKAKEAQQAKEVLLLLRNTKETAR
jgi:hypothetical protein